MMGMHGEAYTNNAIQEADLLLAFGMRFDDRVTGNLATYAKKSRKIHIDIDPSEINKNVKVDVGIAGDLRAVLQQLIPAARREADPAWMARIKEWKKETTARDIIHEDAQTSCSPRTSSATCGASPAATPSPSPTSASTRCGRRSTTRTSGRTRSSPRAASAPWASACPPRSAPRWAGRARRCGRSSATAASR